MRQINLAWFLLALFIWTGVFQFIISFPFASILNTNDVTSSELIKSIVSYGTLFIGTFIGTFITYKRYTTVASERKVLIFFMIINFSLLVLMRIYSSFTFLHDLSLVGILKIALGTLISTVFQGLGIYLAYIFFKRMSNTNNSLES